LAVDSGQSGTNGQTWEIKKGVEKPMGSLKEILPKILGWIVIIITLALAPQINTANDTIIAANNTNLIGLAAIDDFGAPIMILGLLFSGGLLSVAGVKGRMQGASVKEMMSVVGAVVITVLALNLFDQAITYVNELIGPTASGFADVIYGVIPIILYVGIIAGATVYTGVKVIRRRRRNRRSAFA